MKLTKELLIKNLIGLLAKQITFNSSNDSCTIDITPEEFQLQESVGSIPTIYAQEDFTQIQEAIEKVVQYMYKDEKKDYQASEDKENHIFNSIEILKSLIPDYQLI